jgi:hypothetical protein
MDEIHDTSRLDAYMAARRRATVLHALWRPMLAGAAGAALVVACVWVTLPKISYREIEVPRVTMKDVTVPNITSRDVMVDHVVPHDVEVERIVPHETVTRPIPRSPQERSFTQTEGWRDAIVRGRILREKDNGFVLATDEGEASFFPAKIGIDGRPVFDPSVKDVVRPFIDDLGYCRKVPIGTYKCVALHAGREVVIPQVPLGALL